jgi:hypothetical protein
MPKEEVKDQNQPEDAKIVDTPGKPDSVGEEKRVYVVRCTDKVTPKSLGAIINLMPVFADEQKKAILEMLEGVVVLDMTDKARGYLREKIQKLEAQKKGIVEGPDSSSSQAPVEQIQEDLHLDSPITPKVG